MTDSGMRALTALVLTYPPSSIQVCSTGLLPSFRWEFSFPSALHVTAELSALQSSMMADVVGNTSGDPTKPRISFGEQRRLFQGTD